MNRPSSKCEAFEPESQSLMGFRGSSIYCIKSGGKTELMLTILASFAQEESRSISLNVTWGWRKRFADGKPVVPFSHFLGYDRGENGELIVNEEEAETVRLIYGEFLSGLSFNAIGRKLEALGIKSPAGKDNWQGCTVKSILTNEKYKGCALLQKQYTEDYLTKKVVVNEGVVPQYFVEDSHQAIIEPETFDRVQDLIELRSKHRHFSGSTIFSTKLACGECGEFFGPKVWHSTDKYRRVVWRCNGKYADGKRCRTPYLTEAEIKAAFLRAVNSLITGRESLLADLREIQDTYSGMESLEAELKTLDEQMNREVDAVQELISQNARVARNQDEYAVEYDAMVTKYEVTKAKRDKIAAGIRAKGIRHREFERFIIELEKLPDVVTEFDEALWGSFVEKVTVYGKDDIRFLLPCGTEIKA